ncbi:hypothetical protein [Pseudomonas sp. 7-41]|uniref:hypothetical protein n=1 Tax=Pseudomonas sp. 7-41 TaxID=2898483 RepID=UPI001E4170E3|nr:hypothetical protein [Pseudomonas sp. 7-41]UHH01021.1 hypothetical protein LQ249_30535 [Pseudomonas sp. 7-41]
MPSSELPPFEPVTLDELRRIWSAHEDPDIRRLALEVVRYRRVLAEVDKLYKGRIEKTEKIVLQGLPH